jgi:hypothetical protein
VVQLGEEGEAGRVFILRYCADCRYVRKLPVVMIIIIYPFEIECIGIAVKCVMKMYGGK